MNFLNSLNNALDRFFDYIDPIKSCQMSPDYAAYVIQHAYRKHLIRKYFNHLKHCTPNDKSKIKTGWFS